MQPIDNRFVIKFINLKKKEARAEIRFKNVVVLVADDPLKLRASKAGDYRYFGFDTHEKNIKLTMNGPCFFTIDEYNDLWNQIRLVIEYLSENRVDV